VLLVDRLARDPKRFGDLRPGPTVAYGLPDSRVFDAIRHAPQGADSRQCIGGIIGNIDVNDHPSTLVDNLPTVNLSCWEGDQT
jgi:hypothetical protein